MFELNDKIALVTGGGRGIGRGIATCLAKAGATVVVAGRTMRYVEETTQDIKAQGGEAISVEADISKKDDVVQMVEKAIDAFGRIDVLVNNAGVGAGTAGVNLLEGVTEADFDRCYQTNIKGTFLTCQAVVPHMVDRQYGRIINISSALAKRPNLEMCNYAVTKAGINNFTRALAQRLAPHQITVNVICPGGVWTPMIDEWMGKEENRPAELKDMSARQMFELSVEFATLTKAELTPEHIGWTAVFLASDEASQLTGQAINVDSGYDVA